MNCVKCWLFNTVFTLPLITFGTFETIENHLDKLMNESHWGGATSWMNNITIPPPAVHSWSQHVMVKQLTVQQFTRHTTRYTTYVHINPKHANVQHCCFTLTNWTYNQDVLHIHSKWTVPLRAASGWHGNTILQHNSACTFNELKHLPVVAVRNRNSCCKCCRGRRPKLHVGHPPTEALTSQLIEPPSAVVTQCIKGALMNGLEAIKPRKLTFFFSFCFAVNETECWKDKY